MNLFGLIKENCYQLRYEIRQQLDPEKYGLIKDEHILKVAQCLKENRNFELEHHSSPERIEIIDL